MTTNRLVRERPRLTSEWMIAAALLALIAASAGWLAARHLASQPAPAPAPAADRVLTAGRLQLRVAAPWVRTRRPPAVPGLGVAPAWTPYAGLSTTISAALLPVRDASLLPPAVVHAGSLPKPDSARIGGVRARAFRGVRSDGAVLDFYVIPTTRGILTLACRTDGSADEAPAWCLNGLEQVTVAGARPLAATRDTAYRLAAPGILHPLDRARVRERHALRAAQDHTGQGRTAQALADAYATAADRLAPLVPATGAAAAVPRALRAAGAAYHGLAQAAERQDRAGWARYRGEVARAEAAVKRRVAAAG